MKNFTFSIFKFTKPKFFRNSFFAQLNFRIYLGQVLVTIEKQLILHIVVFMSALSKWLVSVDNIIRSNHFYYQDKFLNRNFGNY